MHKVLAPFSDDQIQSINAFQQTGWVHPFTCADREHGGDDILVAKSDGLHCPTCGMIQDYVWDYMTHWPTNPTPPFPPLEML